MVPPSLLFIQTASLRAALRQYCAHFFSYLFFLPSQRVAKRCVGRDCSDQIWNGGGLESGDRSLEKCSISLSRRGPKPSSRRVSAPAAPLPSSAIFHYFGVSHFSLLYPPPPPFFSFIALSRFSFPPVLIHVAHPFQNPCHPCRRLNSFSPMSPVLQPISISPRADSPVPSLAARWPPTTPPPPRLPSHPFITGPCSVNPRGFCLFVLELLLQLATDPTYFLTSHLNSRAALQLLHQLTYH